MATAAPDPRGFDSWEDAFLYPIPTVRALHKRLEIHVGENHEKLRSLVGSSYRDLLGTAQTIVDINDETQHVEELIARAAKRSDSRIIDRISRNYVRLETSRKETLRDSLSVVSQLSVLQKILDNISVLLRTGDKHLLAAKLLVIARLLHRSASATQDDSSTSFAEELSSKLVSLRARLLRHVDRALSSATAATQTIVENLTAFSLATSSSPTDVLLHFQHLRSGTIRRHGPARAADGYATTRKLQLYVNTCRESRAIFPDLIRASLKALSAGPLLKDTSVVELDNLGLDMYEQWIDREVLNYTPFTRHDELSLPKAQQMMHDWTRKAADTLCIAFAALLQQESSFEDLIMARRETLQAWLSSRHHVRDVEHAELLSRLRQPFMARSLAIMNDNLHSLQARIVDPLEKHFSRWRDTAQGPEAGASLWEQSTVDLEASNGAKAIRKTLVDRRFGKSEDTTFDVVTQIEDIVKDLSSTIAQIQRMQDTRWDDDYDVDVDQDDDTQTVSKALSSDDPRALHAQFAASVQSTIESMQVRLVAAAQAGRVLDCSGPNASGLAVFRILRDLRRHIPRLLSVLSSSTAPTAVISDKSEQPFCEPLALQLRSKLASSVSSTPLQGFSQALESFASDMAPFHLAALWDGSPALPILPTPATFRLLQSLSRAMTALGADLWTADVVRSLKHELASPVSRSFKAALTSLSTAAIAVTVAVDVNTAQTVGDTGEPDGPVEGAQETEDGSTSRKDERQRRTTQLFFDMHYLSRAISLPLDASLLSTNSTTDSASDLTKETLSDEERQRIEKAAAEYWRRTYLFFGLLASSS